MSEKLHKIGSPTRPKTVWALPVEKVKNDKGEDEYIMSLPKKVLDFLKLKPNDILFWGERSDHIFEVRKPKDGELESYSIKLGQENVLRRARDDKYKV